MSYQHPQPPGAGSSRVQIPRLPQREGPPPRADSGKHQRVGRACLSCRSRKIKCNGAQPTCSNCSSTTQLCQYASTRKDRLKTATSQNQDMIDLLRNLSQRVTDDDKRRIEDMLSNIVGDVTDAAANLEASPNKQMPDADEERGEANVSAEVGSNENLDIMDEDLMRNPESRATGFLGKNSEIQWLRKLHYDADSDPHGISSGYTGPYGPPGSTHDSEIRRLDSMKRRHGRNTATLMHTSSLSFYLDDEQFDFDTMTDPYEVPPFEVAEPLFRSYVESVHNSFPLLAKKSFTSQFYHYYASVGRGIPYKLPRKWQAMLNLVFAIGAVYSHLTEADWQAGDRDHIVYHARAWELSLKDPWWFSHPDLPRMQITGLLAIYYLSIGHVNRSWVLSGMALRFGYALGLHLRNEDKAASLAKKEVLSRIWWGLYSVEELLSVFTGRPGVGAEMYCSVPLPLPLETEEIEDPIIESRFRGRHTASMPDSISGSFREMADPVDASSRPTNSGSFIACNVKIGQITQKTLTELYTPTLVTKSWESVQQLIARLLSDVETWASALPNGFRFSHRSREDWRYQRERQMLEMAYHNIKIIITRPCLCRLDRRIQNQTDSSNEFNQSVAAACVNAAKAICSLLPDDIDAERVKDIYEKGPWWSMVHNIMQALTVLMLEVSYESAYFPTDRKEVVPSLKKLVRWLRLMRRNNGMARRAYKLAFDLLQKLAGRIRIDISDLMEEDSAAEAMLDLSRPQPASEPELEFPPEQSSSFNQDYPRLHQYGAANDPPSPMPLQSMPDSVFNFQDLFATQASTSTAIPHFLVTTFDQENPLTFESDGWLAERYTQDSQDDMSL